MRWYNLACSLAIGLIGTPQLRTLLFERGDKARLLWQSSIVLNLAILLGTVESLRAGYPGGYRVYLIAVGLTWLLAAVLYTPLMRWRGRHREEGRP